MRFRSTSAPDQYGILALSDDGTFRIVPSDEFRDEMARLEEVALHRAQTFGVRAGTALIALGLAAVAVGWLAGRVFGKLGGALGRPRPVQDVNITWDAGGAVRVTVRGLEGRLQVIQMAWNPDEFLQSEAEAFVAKFDEMTQGIRDIDAQPAP